MDGFTIFFLFLVALAVAVLGGVLIRKTDQNVTSVRVTPRTDGSASAASAMATTAASAPSPPNALAAAGNVTLPVAERIESSAASLERSGTSSACAVIGGLSIALGAFGALGSLFAFTAVGTAAAFYLATSLSTILGGVLLLAVSEHLDQQRASLVALRALVAAGQSSTPQR
jgi:hypothetical protein